MNKRALIDQIRKGNIKSALEDMKGVSHPHDTQWEGSTIFFSAKFHTLEREHHKGGISQDQYNVQFANIVNGLIFHINEYPNPVKPEKELVKTELGMINLLIIPIKNTHSNSPSRFAATLKKRLDSLNAVFDKEDVNIQILDLEKIKGNIGLSFQEARTIGEAENSHLVIWGDLEQSEAGKEMLTMSYISLIDSHPNFIPKKRQSSSGSITDITTVKEGNLTADLETIAYWALGLEYYSGGDYEESLKAFSRIQAKPSSPSTYAVIERLKGDCLYRIEKYEEAIKSYSKSISLGNRVFGTFNNRGLAFTHVSTQLREEKWGNALRDYNEALELEPTNGIGFLNRGVLWYDFHSNAMLSHRKETFLQKSVSDFEEAILWLAEADKGKAWSNLGMVRIKEGNYQEANKCFKAAVEKEPSNIQYHFSLTLTLLEINGGAFDYELLEILLKSSLFKSPDLLSQLGNVFLKKKEWESSLVCIDSLLAIKPEDQISWQNKAYIHQELCQKEKLIQALEGLLKLEPEAPIKIHQQLAEILLSQKKYLEALVHLDYVVVHDPKNEVAWQNKAYIHQELGQKEKLKQALLKISESRNTRD